MQDNEYLEYLANELNRLQPKVDLYNELVGRQLQKNDNKNIVRVLQGKQVVEKEVITGLRNDAGMVEIISGLSQSEQLVIGNKK